MDNVEAAISTIFATSSLLTTFPFNPLAAPHPRNRSSWRLNVMRSVGRYLFGLLSAVEVAGRETFLGGAFFLGCVSALGFVAVGLGVLVLVSVSPRNEATAEAVEDISNLLLMFG